LLAVWLFAAWRYPLNNTLIAARQNVVYGIALAVMVGWLIFACWKQERAHQKVAAAVAAH
jgi:hypothetical protein